jgi:predicted HTH domain antitoxin
MSVEVVVELPEEVFSALRRTPEAFVSEMRLAAAVKWYEMGQLSQGKAAELAGLSRQEFLANLARFGVSPFQVTPEELAKELGRE